MKTRIAFVLLLGLGLSACDGPWNMSVDSHASDQSLWVSSMQVAGHPFDTVWIEPVNSFSTAHSTQQVLETGSKVWIIDSASPTRRDSIAYVQVAGTAAWVPASSENAVRFSSHLLFRAAAIRDGAVQDLSAESYTPSGYAFDSLLGVPLETLHPRLADGTWRDSIVAAVNDDARLSRYAASINDSAPWTSVTLAQLRTYAAGKPVMFNYPCVRRGNQNYRLWSITDPTKVQTHWLSKDQGAISAYSRQWVIRQQLSDRSGYGGTVMLQRFDPSREYIVSPTELQLSKTLGRVDTVGYFQRGDTRLLTVAPRYGGDVPGWPDSILISGIFWGHTGRNRLVSYSVDSLYYEFYRTVGNSSDGQAYQYSNVRGGKGYFTGAAVDSIAFDLESPTADTFAMSHLQRVWCDSMAVQRAKGKSTAIPLSQLKQYCPDKF